MSIVKSDGLLGRTSAGRSYFQARYKLCRPALGARAAFGTNGERRFLLLSGSYWRPRPDSNRGERICSPLRHHSATWTIAKLFSLGIDQQQPVPTSGVATLPLSPAEESPFPRAAWWQTQDAGLIPPLGKPVSFFRIAFRKVDMNPTSENVRFRG